MKHPKVLLRKRSLKVNMIITCLKLKIFLRMPEKLWNKELKMIKNILIWRKKWIFELELILLDGRSIWRVSIQGLPMKEEMKLISKRIQKSLKKF